MVIHVLSKSVFLLQLNSLVFIIWGKRFCNHRRFERRFFFSAFLSLQILGNQKLKYCLIYFWVVLIYEVTYFPFYIWLSVSNWLLKSTLQYISKFIRQRHIKYKIQLYNHKLPRFVPGREYRTTRREKWLNSANLYSFKMKD